MSGLSRKTVANLLQMSPPQILDLMEGFQQRPETLGQFKQLVAHVALAGDELARPIASVKNKERNGVA